MKRFLPLLIIAGVLVLVIVGALALFRSQRTDATTPFANQRSATPAASAPAPTASNIATPAAQTSASVAPTISQPAVATVSVTLEEFGDYQCPPCGLLHPELKKITAEYGSRVNFVFHNFPLTKNHKNALAAAQAAEAARLQGHFAEMHDWLYEHQDAWKDEENPRPTFTKYGREIGLDLKRFAQDMDSPQVQQKIDNDMKEGQAGGVTGTPTIFIEGRQLKPEVMTADGLHKGIDLMLARKLTQR
jgi:protein-disulfide isomerase